MDTESRSAADSIRSAIVAAQVEQAYRHLPVSLLAGLVNGLLLAYFLRDVIAHPALDIWLIALVIVTSARYAALRAYRSRTRSAFAQAPWRRYAVLGACAAGLLWGSAGLFLFHPSSIPHQVLLAFVLGGMVAGGIPLLAFLGPAYPCFAIPMVLPIAFRMLAAGDEVHVIMGLMILVFGGAMLASAAQVRRIFHDSVELQHQLSSSRELSHTLEQMLRVDELTGIANRRLFDDMLEKEWRRATRERTVLSVLAVDIDHFKAYNDHYGHPAGDECIRAVARTMSDTLHRPGDLAARIGGEEFAFLLPDTPIAGALRVSELIRQRVQALGLMHAGPDVKGPVTVSLGVASSENTDIGTAGDLLRAADKALYRAKNQGRNQVAVAD